MFYPPWFRITSQNLSDRNIKILGYQLKTLSFSTSLQLNTISQLVQAKFFIIHIESVGGEGEEREINTSNKDEQGLDIAEVVRLSSFFSLLEPVVGTTPWSTTHRVPPSAHTSHACTSCQLAHVHNSARVGTFSVGNVPPAACSKAHEPCPHRHCPDRRLYVCASCAAIHATRGLTQLEDQRLVLAVAVQKWVWRLDYVNGEIGFWSHVIQLQVGLERRDRVSCWQHANNRSQCHKENCPVLFMSTDSVMQSCN